MRTQADTLTGDDVSAQERKGQERHGKGSL